MFHRIPGGRQGAGQAHRLDQNLYECRIEIGPGAFLKVQTRHSQRLADEEGPSVVPPYPERQQTYYLWKF